jgi:hypothetical protein
MPENSSSNPAAFPVANLPHVKSEHFVPIYSNNVGLSGSFYDAALMFGHIVPNYVSAGKEPYVEDTVSVTMAWEHMKALAAALNVAVEGYEKEHGPIRDVPK